MRLLNLCLALVTLLAGGICGNAFVRASPVRAQTTLLSFSQQGSGGIRKANVDVLAAAASSRNARNSRLKSSSSSDDFVIVNKEITATVKSWNLPNKLTVLRVLLIPVFMFTFITGDKNVNVGIYVFSCLTDWIDGFLARKLKQTSAFGAFLDPVADKLMVATALVLLVCQLPVWWFAVPVALIICRELGVSALREWMAERGARNTIKVGSLGKVKTALQVSISLSLRLKGIFFYTGGVMFHVECCIR